MLLYWSGSGVTERIARQYGGVPLEHYVPEQPCTLMFPSYGAPRTGGYVPPAVMDFLGFHGHCVEYVIGVGNTTFGGDFCRGARLVSEELGVPLVAEIDMVPTERDEQILKFLKEKYEEVPGAERTVKPA